MEEKRKSRVEIRKIQKKYRRRKIVIAIRNIILLVIIFVLSYMFYGMYKEAKVRTISNQESIKNWVNREKDYDDFFELNNIEEIQDEYKSGRVIVMPEIEVVEKYKGYEVECRLEIPEIELNTNVLKEYSSVGLDVCASKYYGPNANEIGNYCIAGHNYNKENMFNHLIDLEIGDNIFLTDNENGVVKYEVYDIYKVKPQNTKPLSQETNGKRELTLITCVNYSKNRLVVKAKEREE